MYSSEMIDMMAFPASPAFARSRNSPATRDSGGAYCKEKDYKHAPGAYCKEKDYGGKGYKNVPAAGAGTSKSRWAALQRCRWDKVQLGVQLIDNVRAGLRSATCTCAFLVPRAAAAGASTRLAGRRSTSGGATKVPAGQDAADRQHWNAETRGAGSAERTALLGAAEGSVCVHPPSLSTVSDSQWRNA